MAPLVRQVRATPPPDLVEVADVEGGFAVVTRILPGGVSLETWLEGAVSGAAPIEPPDDVPPRDQAPPAGTRAPEEEPSSASEPSGARAGGEDYSAYFKIPGGTDPAGGGEPTRPPDAPGPPPGVRESSGPVKEEDYTSFFQPGPAGPGTEPPRPPAPPPGPPATPGREVPPVHRTPPTPEPPPVEAAPPPPTPPPPPPPRDPAPPAAPSTPKATPPQASDSITDMFHKPAPPPPPRPDPHRHRAWQPSEREYVPLQLPLDEYLRRLGSSSTGGASDPGWGGDRVKWDAAPAVRPEAQDGRGLPGGGVGVAEGQREGPRPGSGPGGQPPQAHRGEGGRPAQSRSRDLIILLGIVGIVVVIAAVVVTILVLRSG